MRVKAIDILMELDLRKIKHEGRYRELEKQFEFLCNKYDSLSWHRKLFETDPRLDWFNLGINGEEYEREHRNLFALCRHSITTIDGHIDLPFEYSYLLPQ